MIYFLFHTIRGIAPFIAIGAAIAALIMLVLFLLTAGASIRTSAAGGRPSKKAALFRLLMILFTTVVIMCLASALFGETAIKRAPLEQDTSNKLLQLIVGPETINIRRAIQFALITGMAIFAANLLFITQTAQGSPLRLWIDRFRGINRKQEAHGSAHFATLQEFKRFRKEQTGGINFYGRFYGSKKGPQKFTYLADKFSLCPEDAARGIITIGNPGSGKSSSVILPIIFDSMRLGQNLIITDPQLELRDHIMRYAGATGHRVIIHDPTASNLPRYNLAQGIKTVSQAQAVADVLTPKNAGGVDGFWTKSAQNLLAACLLRYDNIGAIYNDFGNTRAMANKLGQEADDAQRLAGAFINSVADADGKFATNVIATLATALAGWADSAIRDSTAASDFAARDLVQADQPTVLVLACPGAERRVIAPYLGGVLTKILLDLDRIGEKQADGQLPIPVKFVLEEFPALGDLSAVVEFANLVRKRRISFILACQTMGQLENIYGRSGTETLLAGMAFQIIFGGCDQATARYYSDAAGTTTNQETDKTGKTQSRSRKLLTPDEIIRPPQGNSTIFGRYVLAEYATYIIVLSRLTRIYERKDVAAAIKKIDRQAALQQVMRRGHDPSQQQPEVAEVAEVAPPEAVTTPPHQKRPTAPAVERPKRPVVVKPIGVIR